MMTASSSMDELSCSSISFNTDAAATTAITTKNGNDDNYSDHNFPSVLKEFESYNAIASTAVAVAAKEAPVRIAAAVVERDDERDTNIHVRTDINVDLVPPPPPPHIELLHLSTDATVKDASLINSSGCNNLGISHTDGEITCITLVVSYLDENSRESARMSCSYLRGAVHQYNRASLPPTITTTVTTSTSTVEELEEHENEQPQTCYLQDLLREQRPHSQSQEHPSSLSSLLERRIDYSREVIPHSLDTTTSVVIEPLMNNGHDDTTSPQRSQPSPPMQYHPRQPTQQLLTHLKTPEAPAHPPRHDDPSSPHDHFRYASESFSSSLKTESLDDSTLLSSSYPQQPPHSILGRREEEEEYYDDEESWELNPAAHYPNEHHHPGWDEEDSSVVDNNDACHNSTKDQMIENNNAKILSNDDNDKEEKEEEEEANNNSTAPDDILAQLSDAMLYGDTPPVLSQFMSGIVDSAKLAVSQLYQQQYRGGGGGGIGWRNRIDDDNGVDDAGPIKIGDKYYSHNEALQRWRRAKVKLEDRYHGMDAEGNVKMERTTYFEKSSLFQDRDAKGEKITLRNYWDGGGDEVPKEENNGTVDGEGDEEVMSIDHLVKTYAMIKKEAKIHPVVNEIAKEDANDSEVGENDDNFGKNCNSDATKGADHLGLKKGDLVDGDTAALSSSTSSSSWDSLPTMAPPPPPPEQHATPPPARAQNVSNTPILQGDEETNCLAEEESLPTDISRMSSQGVAFNFIGDNAVRKDCEQSVLGSQYGMEVLLKVPKKTVVARKPRTLASHNFSVAKVVARHGPATKQSDFIWPESGGDGAAAAAVTNTTMTTAKQEVTMPPSPLRSHSKQNKTPSWTNRTKSTPQHNAPKILPLKLKLGMKKSVKS